MILVHTVILGVVEGVTEFLPISSTAHLEITQSLLGIAQTNFVKSFSIAIQLGAILAVVVLYAKRLFASTRLWKPILAAFLPTAAIGFVLYKIIKTLLLGNSWIIVAALFLGGIVLMVFEKPPAVSDNVPRDVDSEIERMSIKNAVIIGLAQSLAVIPGVSRSAATIVAGRLLGVSRVAIVEFSFLLAIPTMIAATGYDLLKSASAFTSSDVSALVVGFIVSFFAALFAVRFLLDYVKHHSFAAFGAYRIALAVLFAFFLLASR